jgi:mitochondrial fission protein ELM1
MAAQSARRVNGALTRRFSRRKPRRMEIARVICNDLAGLRNQAVGLAEAAGIAADVRVLPKSGWLDRLPGGLGSRRLASLAPGVVAAPLPGLIIACGGAGARIAAGLRGKTVRAVAIQDPRMSLKAFDLVFAARHDGIAGPNVFITRTALHRVTPARLAAEAAAWRPVFNGLPRPLTAVLLGGANGRYRFGVAEARALAGQLARLAQGGAGIAITPSRRTSPAVLDVLRAALAPFGAYIWDGAGENPYFGMLALADAIIVTADSVSMVSEAAATAAPVYLVRLPGKSARIGAFMDMMVADGRCRDFTGVLDLWDAAPMDDTPAAGAALRHLLGLTANG